MSFPVRTLYYCQLSLSGQIIFVHTHIHQMSPTGAKSEADPERLFTKQERIGRGSFGEVYKGWVVGLWVGRCMSDPISGICLVLRQCCESYKQGSCSEDHWSWGSRGWDRGYSTGDHSALTVWQSSCHQILWFISQGQQCSLFSWETWLYTSTLSSIRARNYGSLWSILVEVQH